ncbi:AraC family transcriptional regulator [Thalassospira sp.]|uniref:helix-turn-helix domain-containing protein n=1 Tax=Thalassospira sp. TaxID=1912094 RepID=UPI0027328B2E|nr:AraC family transcriptional regulator [Thalassospira sp.]MDP2696558.1 AraC family transcriptional regulator [Thalassospira sp.]
MTFHPHMTSRVEGVTLLDNLRYKRWNSAITDLWHVSCARHTSGSYVSHAPRLVAILAKSGAGEFQVSHSADHDQSQDSNPNGNLFYVPAGMPLSSHTSDACELTHLDIHLDVRRIVEHCAYDIDRQALETPRICFTDPRLMTLARLIADECRNPDNTNALYGESLITAMIAALLGPQPETTPSRGQLAPYQLRKSVDYITQNCARTIRLDELAQLTGLSQTYFCSAFRASTGMPPHKWQMKARIDTVKAQLANSDMPLASVAIHAGFADQAHLTRVFRQIVGTTPGAWRRERAA